MCSLLSNPIFAFFRNLSLTIDFFLTNTRLFDLIFVNDMIENMVLYKTNIKLALQLSRKRSYIRMYKGMVVYKGPGDDCIDIDSAI